MKTNLSIAIIGVGRLGGALALALSKKGFEIRQLISRSAEKASKIAEIIQQQPEILAPEDFDKISAEVVFIATPDAEIQTVADNLSRKLKHQPFVFHTSGALSSEILKNLKSNGCGIGSLHPLVSISDSVTGAGRFKNAFFCIEGDAESCEIAEKIVAGLEGKSFSVATKYKALYHASAVMASGHLVALFSAAIEALSACGLNENEARKILFPLVSSTIENLAVQSPHLALTGTYARADVETLKLHLKNLRENVSEEVFALYRQLGLRSLSLAERQGADAEKLAEMEILLHENSEPKNKANR
jgi:predicted short-subunit dehydrogenase-like oxidoreductase (DUF2520 family)